MTYNFSRLTHAIMLFNKYGFISNDESRTCNLISSKNLLIESFQQNPNELAEYQESARTMLYDLKNNKRNSFVSLCISAIEDDEDNSEGYIVTIPKLHKELLDRLDLLAKIPNPDVFLEDVRSYDGHLLVIKHDTSGKVYGITGDGILLTFYEKQKKLPIDEYVKIYGFIKKRKFTEPWETQLHKIKYFNS